METLPIGFWLKFRTVFFPLLCAITALSTKCFHVRHLMSLTAMLIDGIRYFDKNRPCFHLLITSRLQEYELCYCHNLALFSRTELYFDQPYMTEAKFDSKTEDMAHFHASNNQKFCERNYSTQRSVCGNNYNPNTTFHYHT